MLNKFDLVKLLSISGHYRGFSYLLDCVNLAVEDEDLLHPIAQKLYPLVAKRHKTTVAHVSSAIRGLVRVWWKRGNRAFAPAYLAPDATAPGNKAFIHALVAHVQRSAQSGK